MHEDLCKSLSTFYYLNIGVVTIGPLNIVLTAIYRINHYKKVFKN